MNTNIAVNNYRKKHHRCKTCVYAQVKTKDWIDKWVCRAKHSYHEGDLYNTVIAGMFCGLYSPILLIEEQDEC